MVGNIASLSAAPHQHKKQRVYRHSNGYIMHVVCGGCSRAVFAYSHSQTDITCKECNTPLLKSTGGLAEVLGETKFKKAENSY